MEKSNIRGLFSSRTITYCIPEYQRAYSWGEEQISQFITDLKECHGQYYLGHFLFDKKADGLFEIIDGQQRLTTVVIFYRALIDVVKGRKDTSKEDENWLYGLSDDYLKEPRNNRSKFNTVGYDNQFFEDFIVCGKQCTEAIDTKSERCIVEAYKEFKKEFERISSQDLRNLSDTLENAEVTTFVISNKQQAAQMFAFQNDRGKRLTDLEVVKAYLMLQVYVNKGNDEDINYIESKFCKIYHTIEKISLGEDTVLRYYCQAKYDTYYIDNTVSEVKKRLKTSEGNAVVDIKDFVVGLSIAFDAVDNVENGKDNPAELKHLVYLDHMAWSYPLIIKAKLLNVDGSGYKHVVKFLENITFRHLVVGSRANLLGVLQEILNPDVVDSEKLINSIGSTIGRLNNWSYWRQFWGDERFKEQIANVAFYPHSNNTVAYYLLWRYELSLNPSYNGLSLDDVMEDRTFEHIAPRTENGTGYGLYENHENPEEGIVSGGWLDNIGNLVLMERSQNSSLGNCSFADKLAVYGRGPLMEQKEIYDFVSDKEKPVWDVTAIKKRSEEIAEVAKHLWSFDNI